MYGGRGRGRGGGRGGGGGGRGGGGGERWWDPAWRAQKLEEMRKQRTPAVAFDEVVWRERLGVLVSGHQQELIVEVRGGRRRHGYR